eukprot:36586_1
MAISRAWHTSKQVCRAAVRNGSLSNIESEPQFDDEDIALILNHNPDRSDFVRHFVCTVAKIPMVCCNICGCDFVSIRTGAKVDDKIRNQQCAIFPNNTIKLQCLSDAVELGTVSYYSHNWYWLSVWCNDEMADCLGILFTLDWYKRVNITKAQIRQYLTHSVVTNTIKSSHGVGKILMSVFNHAEQILNEHAQNLQSSKLYTIYNRNTNNANSNTTDEDEDVDVAMDIDVRDSDGDVDMDVDNDAEDTDDVVSEQELIIQSYEWLIGRIEKAELYQPSEYTDTIKNVYNFLCDIDAETNFNLRRANQILKTLAPHKMYKHLAKQSSSTMVYPLLDSHPSAHDWKLFAKTFEEIADHRSDCIKNQLAMLRASRRLCEVLHIMKAMDLSFDLNGGVTFSKLKPTEVGDKVFKTQMRSKQKQWRRLAYFWYFIGTAVAARCPKMLLYFPSAQSMYSTNKKHIWFGARSTTGQTLIEWNKKSRNELSSQQQRILDALRF